MQSPVRRALDDLPPEGREFKIHLLRRLLGNAPEPLSVSEAMKGGPNRTFASGWYAVKALERISVLVAVPKTAQCRVARYRLADGVEEVVKDFVTDRIQQESPPLSPLPASPQYKQVLTVLFTHPDTWFTVNELTSKLIRVRKCARRPTTELHAAGYLLRRVSDAGKPGRAEYQYRLNPQLSGMHKRFSTHELREEQLALSTWLREPGNSPFRANLPQSGTCAIEASRRMRQVC